MRHTLDTVGKRAGRATPRDARLPGRVRGAGDKLDRPLHPPGRDVRCIVSVGMLTEGWDCNTVTHIVGLRPFMSQLLCEQVVGRGLRRASYDVGEDGKLTEEVAKVLGVPFEVIPFKQSRRGRRRSRSGTMSRVPEKAAVRDPLPARRGLPDRRSATGSRRLGLVPPVRVDPTEIADEVEVKAALPDQHGPALAHGPGSARGFDLSAWRGEVRLQERSSNWPRR